MSACDDFILKMEKTLPDIVETHELVKVGVYPSLQSAYHARKSKNSPDYFSIGRRVFYPKSGIIEWLRMHKGNESTSYKNKEKTQSL